MKSKTLDITQGCIYTSKHNAIIFCIAVIIKTDKKYSLQKIALKVLFCTEELAGHVWIYCRAVPHTCDVVDVVIHTKQSLEGKPAKAIQKYYCCAFNSINKLCFSTWCKYCLFFTDLI